MAEQTPGDVIRHYRELGRMTQEEMAVAVGRTEPAAYQWEHNIHHPRRVTAVKLDRLLKAEGAILRALGYVDPASEQTDEISLLRAEMAELRRRVSELEGRHERRTGDPPKRPASRGRKRAAG